MSFTRCACVLSCLRSRDRFVESRGLAGVRVCTRSLAIVLLRLFARSICLCVCSRSCVFVCSSCHAPERLLMYGCPGGLLRSWSCSCTRSLVCACARCFRAFSNSSLVRVLVDAPSGPRVRAYVASMFAQSPKHVRAWACFRILALTCTHAGVNFFLWCVRRFVRSPMR